MAHTFHQNHYHLVWSTKERIPLMTDEHKNRIFEYLAGSFQTLKCTPVQIGGMADHVHILVIIPPTLAVAEIIRDIKIASTKWINGLSNMQRFSWQEGYGSFTVSTSQIEQVRHYILNQETHHKTRDYREEFLEFLKLHEIEYDEKYLWK